MTTPELKPRSRSPERAQRVLSLQQTDVKGFLDAPIGRFTLDRHALVAYPDRDFRICAVWGRPRLDELRDLLRLLEVILHPDGARELDTLTDVSAITGVDMRAFQGLLDHAVHGRLKAAKRIRRQAIVRPRSVVGAVVTGLYDLIGHGFPVRFFETRGAALEWLGRPDARAVQQWIEQTIPLAELSSRETNAVALAAEGHGNKEIAYRMTIAASTVSVLLHRAARKLGVRSRPELVAAYRRRA